MDRFYMAIMVLELYGYCKGKPSAMQSSAKSSFCETAIKPSRHRRLSVYYQSSGGLLLRVQARLSRGLQNFFSIQSHMIN